jgi:hypothetical protein
MTQQSKSFCLLLVVFLSLFTSTGSFTTSLLLARPALAPHLLPVITTRSSLQSPLSHALMGRRYFLTSSPHERRESSRLPLHMLELGSVEAAREEKIREAKRLADEATKALEAANEAGAKVCIDSCQCCSSCAALTLTLAEPAGCRFARRTRRQDLHSRQRLRNP